MDGGRLKCALVRARVLKLFVAAAVALLVVLGVSSAAASPAGNHLIWSDPTGDNQSQSSTVYASDIRQVELTSQDNGAVKIAITLVDGDGKLVSGDELDVLIDYDRNQSTGDSGFDIELVATGHSGSAATFVLCRLSGTRSCEEGPTDWAHDTPGTTTGTHVVDFNVSAGVAAFDFGVVESYTSGSTTLKDIAPNSGLYTFELRADPDNDGVQGTSDKCPTVAARGKSDANHNGCPGPFKLIGTKEAHFAGVVFPAFMRLNEVRVTGTPPGSRVVFSSPKGGDSATVNSSGVAKSRRVKGDFRYGSVITIRITKPQFVGVFLKEKVARGGLQVLQRRCIPATGGSPVKCSGKLKGS
jgi:hypothetical protein